MIGQGPKPKKPKPKLPTISDVMIARDALPRPSHPRTIPYFYVKKHGERGGVDTIPLEQQLQVASIPDPTEPIVPLPAALFGSVHLDRGKVPDALAWQAPFLDTLTQLVGHQPGSVAAEPSISAGTWGNFSRRGRRITLGGNIFREDNRPNELRTSAAHEWAHLLTSQEDPILQAFMTAAPLPTKLRTEAALNNFDFNEWPKELAANEAFADMFAAALGQHLPQMQPERGRATIDYPFTAQFGGRSRQRMVDSLVNVLLPRLQQ